MNNEDFPGCVCDPETGRVCLFHYDLDAALLRGIFDGLIPAEEKNENAPSSS